MDEKITFSQLCNMVALRSKMSRITTEDFLRELFSMVSQSLAEGDSVKLKGIGTFKVQKVGVRKSVDVTTGREIIIPEHSKITYTPSKELASAVNAPFEAYEAVEISDELSDEEMNEDTVVELSELETAKAELPVGVKIEQVGSTPDAEATEQQAESIQQAEPTQQAETPADNATAPVFEKLVATPIASAEDQSSNDIPQADSTAEEAVEITTNSTDTDATEPIVTETTESEAIEAEPSIESTENEDTLSETEASEETANNEEPQYSAPVDDDTSAEEIEEEEESSKRRSKLWIIILSSIAAVACVFIALLLLYPDIYRSLTGSECSKNGNTAQVAQVATTEVKEAEDVATDLTTPANQDTEKEKLMPETTPSDATTATADDQVVYDTISKTRYLTTMAKEHYGNFHFWPYIYKENEAFLGHPDRIKPGTQVVIPPLSKYGVDPKNKKDEAEAKRLGIEIYNKYKK
jgi:nucleoid DNA-binding protein